MSPRASALPALVLACALAACRPPPKDAPETPVQAAGVSGAPLGQLALGEPDSPLPVEEDDARLGAEGAPVTVVAFLDFQCGHCRDGFQALEQLRRGVATEQLRVVVKHLPMSSHPMALPAALAGQAVQEVAGSEAFFEFANLAFRGQAQMDFVRLAEWAEQAGVPRSAYNEAVSDERLLRHVARDARLAQSLGVNMTPAFFVNGRLLAGAQPLATLKQAVDEEAGAMSALGGSWSERYAARVRENTERSLVHALLAEDPGDYLVPVAGSATSGAASAPVTVVMFTDFECPYCKRAAATIEELERAHPGKLRLVFKHLPLHFHQHARKAALLAEAIREKRGDEVFFAAAKELFAQSPELDRDVLERLGKQFGLTSEAITASLERHEGAAALRLQEDAALAEDVQAEGTPHFFINGKRLAGARPISHFEALVRSELERAEEQLRAGVPASGLYEVLQRGAAQPGMPKRLTQVISVAGRPVRGAVGAPVAIHVFSDFQCPYCKQAEVTLTELEKLYPGQLLLVWHDRPLEFHERALPAARAGAEAFRQGGSQAFWKMHDAIYAFGRESPALGREDLLGHAAALGLDVQAFERALDTAEAVETIVADAELADSLGFRGTPAFVVGGYPVTGAKRLEHFQRLVELTLREGPAKSPEK